MTYLAMLACSVLRIPQTPAPAPVAQPPDWQAVLAAPGPLTWESTISARWEVNLRAVLDLKHPVSRDNDLRNRTIPIVLPVHVLSHPDHGVFIVDTGVGQQLVEDGTGPLRGLVKRFAKTLQPVESLSSILARQSQDLAGVLLTHAHFDHVLGLPDVPAGIPVYAGAGELTERGLLPAAMRPTLRQALRGVHLSVLEPAQAVRADPFDHAWDLLGDGSLWALASPGHSAGSTAYLALTTDGPVLFVGDTSHTRWGWDHGVPPGRFTADGPTNQVSLDRLRKFAARHPGMRVEVGHEQGDGVSLP